MADKSGLLSRDTDHCQDYSKVSANSTYDFIRSTPEIKYPKVDEKHKGDFSVNRFPLTLQIPPVLQSQHQISRLVPPVSPKAGTRIETSSESSGKSSLLMPSPVSPSRKFFKKIPSPAGKRRGSEPALDAMSKANLQQAQLYVTDRRWEKLRAILVAMRDKPFDVKECLSSSSSQLLDSLQEKIDANNEKIAVQGELLYLQDVLKQKELALQQAEAERDSALAYIRHLKANMSDAEEQTMELYKHGIESLKASSVSKDNVIDIVSSLTKELYEQKSYLDCLMTVVLMRAPWMLDEVDRMEPPKSQDVFLTPHDILDEEDSQSEDSDNEVWC